FSTLLTKKARAAAPGRFTSTLELDPAADLEADQREVRVRVRLVRLALAVHGAAADARARREVLDVARVARAEPGLRRDAALQEPRAAARVLAPLEAELELADRHRVVAREVVRERAARARGDHAHEHRLAHVPEHQ